MNQKGQIQILIGILILVIIAGGAYYLGKSNGPKLSAPVVSQTPQPTPSPTSDASPPAPNGAGETANWRTYTSPLGFSVKYPPDLFVQEHPGSKGGVVFVRKEEFLKYENHIDMEILWRDSSNPIDVMGRQLQNTILNDYQAVKISDDQKYEESVWIFNPDKTKVFRVIITTRYDSDPYKQSSFDIYQKILSTFKFLP